MKILKDDEPDDSSPKDVIDSLPPGLLLHLAKRCHRMSENLDVRGETLNELGGGELDSDLQKWVAATTERLALFEMEIETLTMKLDRAHKKIDKLQTNSTPLDFEDFLGN
tara:strand:- start:10106 stop:10435 length:330 start_codon:yes stop_codon:yes gene_type:complete